MKPLTCYSNSGSQGEVFNRAGSEPPKPTPNLRVSDCVQQHLMETVVLCARQEGRTNPAPPERSIQFAVWVFALGLVWAQFVGGYGIALHPDDFGNLRDPPLTIPHPA